MIRIGIVDDHAIVRAGLIDHFSQYVDFRVVGEGSSGREAIDLVRNTPMDVLVMDLTMPSQSGIDAISMVRAKAADVAILILSGHAEGQYAIELIRQGARGYLSKDCEPSEIAKAIRIIALGRRYLSPGVSELLANQLTGMNRGLPHQALSKREFQVFIRLSRGERASVIAADLSLSVKTVSTYRARLLQKMHMASNSDLTYYALKKQLIQ